MVAEERSGLLEWHRSVIKGNIEVVIIDQPKEILYEDEYQIIFDKNLVKVKGKLSLSEFLEKIRMGKLYSLRFKEI